MSDPVRLRAEGHVLTVTLARPERMNALGSPVCEALGALARRVEADVDVRCVIVTGAGRAFCAGADLKERRALGPEARWRYVEGLNRAIRQVENIPVPVVAAINGFALGGGVELLLACDYRIAVRAATFGLPETALGIIPGGSIVRLLGEIAPSRAAWMTYTAERFGAERARAIGLVDEVVEDEAALGAASAALAARIAANAPLALRAAKRLTRRLRDAAIEQGMAVAEEIRAPLDATEDCLEGLRAFEERRPPRFRGA